MSCTCKKEDLNMSETSDADSEVSVEDELKELQEIFDMRWDADMRATKRWQAAGPGRDLTWPDHADLVVWLLERLEEAEAKVTVAEALSANTKSSKLRSSRK